MIFLILVGVLILSILNWNYTIRPLRDMQSQLTANMKEAIAPDIQKYANLIITLSSASIVLTFTILQAIDPRTLKYEEYLVSSWVFFAVCMLLMVFSINLLFVARAQLKVAVNKYKTVLELYNEVEVLDKARHAKEITEKFEEIKQVKPKEAMSIATSSERLLFLTIYCGSVSFLSAFLLLIVFAIQNT